MNLDDDSNRNALKLQLNHTIQCHMNSRTFLDSRNLAFGHGHLSKLCLVTQNVSHDGSSPASIVTFVSNRTTLSLQLNLFILAKCKPCELETKIRKPKHGMRSFVFSTENKTPKAKRILMFLNLRTGGCGCRHTDVKQFNRMHQNIPTHIPGYLWTKHSTFKLLLCTLKQIMFLHICSPKVVFLFSFRLKRLF